mgnify:CR=1 FL=1
MGLGDRIGALGALRALGADDDIIDRLSKDEYVDFEHTENQMFDEITDENDEARVDYRITAQ